jgi:hypothetical protein
MTNFFLLIVVAACLFFGMRACLIRDALRTHGCLLPAKVLAVGGIRGGIAVTYSYEVAGHIYTRTSALGGRYTVPNDSIYLKYLPQDPTADVRIYLSRAEVNSPLYN